MCVCTIACGKKGPPLPPLVRVPSPPDGFTAERRGEEVKLQFTVPSANTDGTRPADVQRVDVYAFSGPFTVDDEQLMKFGTKVASVPVKAPKNPGLVTEPEEPAEEPELEGDGLDQSAVAQVEELLTDAAFTPVELPKAKGKKPVVEDAVDRPLPGPPREVPWRIFMAVGVNTKGKNGPPSARMIVPLVPPPAAPADATIAYDEKAITLTWKPSSSWAPIQPTASDDLLPGRFFGMEVSAMSYNVYDVSPSVSGASPTSPTGSERLLGKAIADLVYEDKRMDWGDTRCYVVRSFQTITGQTLESDTPGPVCTTLNDTFPPAAPKDLRLIATQGVISLIWEPSGASDIAGYHVLRGTVEDTLDPITPAPITETTFTDMVPTGTSYWYAVQAIDRAGNVSPSSSRVEGLSR